MYPVRQSHSMRLNNLLPTIICVCTLQISEHNKIIFQCLCGILGIRCIARIFEATKHEQWCGQEHSSRLTFQTAVCWAPDAVGLTSQQWCGQEHSYRLTSLKAACWTLCHWADLTVSDVVRNIYRLTSQTAVCWTLYAIVLTSQTAVCWTLCAVGLTSQQWCGQEHSNHLTFCLHLLL